MLGTYLLQFQYLHDRYSSKVKPVSRKLEIGSKFILITDLWLFIDFDGGKLHCYHVCALINMVEN